MAESIDSTNIADLPNEMIYQIIHYLNYNDMVSLCDTNKDIKSVCDDTLWKYKTNYDFEDASRYLLLDNENYRQRYLRIASYKGEYYKGSEKYVNLNIITSNMGLVVLPQDYDYFLSRISSDKLHDAMDSALKHNKIDLFWKIIKQDYNGEFGTTIYNPTEIYNIPIEDLIVSAAAYNHIDIVEDMLKTKGEDDQNYSYLYRAASAAAQNCHFGDIFDLLFQRAEEISPEIPDISLRNREVFRKRYENILISASKCGNIDIIKRIISDIDAISLDITTKMIKAAAIIGHADIIDYIMRLRFIRNIVRNNNAKRGMIVAGLYGHIDIIKMLEPYINNVNSIRIYNWTMLNAAQGGHVEIIERMLSLGANDYNKAMIAAAENGHIDIVNLMLEKGANDYHFTAIEAARRGHIEIVKRMIELGANKYGKILIAAAAPFTCYTNNDLNGEDEEISRHIEIINLILQNYYSPNKYHKYTLNRALLEASWRGYIEIVQYLLDNVNYDMLNKSMDDINNVMVNTILRSKCSASVDIIQLLLHYDAQRLDLIIDAAAKGYVDIVRLLIYTIDELYYNDTAHFKLLYTFNNLNLSSKYLHPKDFYNKAMIEAASSGHIGIVQILLDAGADAYDDVLDKEGLDNNIIELIENMRVNNTQ